MIARARPQQRHQCIEELRNVVKVRSKVKAVDPTIKQPVSADESVKLEIRIFQHMQNLFEPRMRDMDPMTLR